MSTKNVEAKTKILLLQMINKSSLLMNSIIINRNINNITDITNGLIF